MKCIWCESENAVPSTNHVFWELPDGTRAITISCTPCVKCDNCGMEYQEETTINEIEDQLLLINTSKLANKMTYDELMAIPRILKKNYFR